MTAMLLRESCPKIVFLNIEKKIEEYSNALANRKIYVNDIQKRILLIVFPEGQSTEEIKTICNFYSKKYNNIEIVLEEFKK